MEKEMATHSSILAWRIPGMGEPGGCCLWSPTESDTTEATQQQQQHDMVNAWLWYLMRDSFFLILKSYNWFYCSLVELYNTKLLTPSVGSAFLIEGFLLLIPFIPFSIWQFYNWSEDRNYCFEILHLQLVHNTIHQAEGKVRWFKACNLGT